MKAIKILLTIALLVIFITAWAGSLEITWTAPTMREDGSALALSEIAGYRLYYGTAAGDYQTQVDINDPSAIDYTLLGLVPDTYYLVLTTIDTDGRESRYSTEITKVITGLLAIPNTVTNLILNIEPDPARAVDELQVLYKFDAGVDSAVVYDVSGVTPELNLFIADMNAITWGNGTLTINQPTIINSLVSATKLNTSISAANEITIEAWIAPANITQTGPSRIVGLSLDTSNRNTTLGQSTNAYNVRLRTSNNSLNGSSPSVPSPSGTATVNLTHVVYTREADGNTKIYIDNVLVSHEHEIGDFSNWDMGYELVVANEYTNNRPWLGTFNLIAIYSRALTKKEVNNNYIMGPNPKP